MPDEVLNLAGATIGVSATLAATIDSSGFGALSFTTIGEIIDVGEFGKEFEISSHKPVTTRAIQKFKGAYDLGSTTFAMARDDDDAGQVIALAALASDNSYAFKIAYSDSTIDYFHAKVSSYKTASGDVNSMVNRMMSLEFTSEIVIV